MGITISLLNVRRSILIQAPPERVWQEFESFDRFAAWFGLGHELHSGNDDEEEKKTTHRRRV